MDNKREEVLTLRAMLLAAQTKAAVDGVAETIRKLKLMRELGGDIGTANARLAGVVSNCKQGEDKVLYPAVYYKPGRRHRYLVSGGRVVGKPDLTVEMLWDKGYKFGRMIR